MNMAGCWNILRRRVWTACLDLEEIEDLPDIMATRVTSSEDNIHNNQIDKVCWACFVNNLLEVLRRIQCGIHIPILQPQCPEGYPSSLHMPERHSHATGAFKYSDKAISMIISWPSTKCSLWVSRGGRVILNSFPLFISMSHDTCTIGKAIMGWINQYILLKHTRRTRTVWRSWQRTISFVANRRKRWWSWTKPVRPNAPKDNLDTYIAHWKIPQATDRLWSSLNCQRPICHFLRRRRFAAKLYSNAIFAASMAMSEPLPRAIPISAALSPGASLTPSPVTILPLRWKRCTICNFCSGVIRAKMIS